MLSLSVIAYLSQSESHKDISRYLFALQKKVKNGEWKSIFISVGRIVERTGCSERTVHRYISAVNGFPIKITKRNGQTSIYEMDDEFFKALQWLEMRNLLYVKKSRHESIIKEAERWQEKGKMAPPISRGEWHPSLPLSSAPQEYDFINPLFEEIKISRKDKITLSKYPEFAISEGLEDTKWYLKNINPKIDKPFEFLRSVISKRARTKHKNRIEK